MYTHIAYMAILASTIILASCGGGSNNISGGTSNITDDFNPPSAQIIPGDFATLASIIHSSSIIDIASNQELPFAPLALLELPIPTMQVTACSDSGTNTTTLTGSTSNFVVNEGDAVSFEFNECLNTGVSLNGTLQFTVTNLNGAFAQPGFSATIQTKSNLLTSTNGSVLNTELSTELITALSPDGSTTYNAVDLARLFSDSDIANNHPFEDLALEEINRGPNFNFVSAGFNGNYQFFAFEVISETIERDIFNTTQWNADFTFFEDNIVFSSGLSLSGYRTETVTPFRTSQALDNNIPLVVNGVWQISLSSGELIEIKHSLDGDITTVSLDSENDGNFDEIQNMTYEQFIQLSSDIVLNIDLSSGAMLNVMSEDL